MDTARIFLSSLPIHGGLVGLGLGICEWVVVFGVWGTRISGLRWGISGGGGWGSGDWGPGLGFLGFSGLGEPPTQICFGIYRFFHVVAVCLLVRLSVRPSRPDRPSEVWGLGVGEPPK